jgi:NADH-quinone oxidoreductase subunit N
MLHDLFLVLPELFLTDRSIALLLVAAWGGTSRRAVTWIAVAACAWRAVSLAAGQRSRCAGVRRLVTGDLFAVFGRSDLRARPSLCCSRDLVRPLAGLPRRIPGADPLLAIGGGMMVTATDLLTVYAASSCSAYPPTCSPPSSAPTPLVRSGLKYFVLGALASGLLLYGISLLYGFTGSTLFSDIAVALQLGETAGHNPIGQLFGVVFVLAGVAFKVSAVPFHMWTPDVYEGAPTPVTAFFASAPKVAAMILLTRVAIEAMGPAFQAWQQIIIFMALASTILGGVAAIGQGNIKRLLAYSSINNVGFALVGLAAAGVAGVSSILFYMAVYVVMTLGSFLIVLRMRDVDGQPVESIDGLAGLSRTRPALPWRMAMFMLSLAGIPPLFGFWPKFLVFDAAVQATLPGFAP